jgi:serine phosphatase RsbU (regulator of sigma subunit)
VDRLASTDLPLGVVPGDTWQSHTARLSPGDALVVVSDGVLDRFPVETEALENGSSPFGPVTHAQALVDAVALLPADEPLEDDLTIVVLRRRRPRVS